MFWNSHWRQGPCGGEWWWNEAGEEWCSLQAGAAAVHVAGLSSGVYALMLRGASGTYGGRMAKLLGLRE